MEPPLPSYTRTWHTKSYPAISPKRPELSAAGKTVAITGGGRGIGRGAALAFAEAGAAHVVLLARRTADLNEAKEAITKSYTKTKVSTYSVDVTDEAGLNAVAKDVGSWDVLVLNAGVEQSPVSLALDGDFDSWWRVFEINTKGTMLAIRAFAPTRKVDSKFIGVTTSAFLFPSSFLAKTSAYVVSKLAQAKALEFLCAEYPDMYFGMLNPGLIDTDLVKETGITGLTFDDPDLASHFIVWAASPEASFTRGKLIYSSFDVDELKAKADRLSSSNDLMIGLEGLQ